MLSMNVAVSSSPNISSMMSRARSSDPVTLIVANLVFQHAARKERSTFESGWVEKSPE